MQALQPSISSLYLRNFHPYENGKPLRIQFAKNTDYNIHLLVNPNFSIYSNKIPVNIIELYNIACKVSCLWLKYNNFDMLETKL